MRQLQPVIWSKGTFLSPQHLQAQERFVEDSARFYLDSLNPKCWGFSDFQIDAKALSEGALSVTRASGIFPTHSHSTFPFLTRHLRPGRWMSASRMAGRLACSTSPSPNIFRVA